MKLVNLTPHPVVLRDFARADDVGGSLVYVNRTIPPSGVVARVKAIVSSTLQEVEVGLAGIDDDVVDPPTTIMVVGPPTWGEVEGLPSPDGESLFIVSALVAARTQRADVVSPDTGETCFRSADGRIEAVRRFIRSA